MMRFRVTRTGTSVTFEEQKGNERLMSYAKDIRGAVVWPSTPVPGYALIMAQRDFFEKGKFPLVLLAEVCDSKPTIFFKKLFDQAARLSCRQFYAELEDKNENEQAVFRDYAAHHSAITIWLEPAASRSLEFAFCLIEEWTAVGGVEADEGTILAGQLEQAGQQDLKNPEQTFAIKALAYIISSLEKDPWSAPNLFPSSGGRSRLGGVI